MKYLSLQNIYYMHLIYPSNSLRKKNSISDFVNQFINQASFVQPSSLPFLFFRARVSVGKDRCSARKNRCKMP